MDARATSVTGHLGPYRLLQVIGGGGMGVVHLALDPEERAVAVKVLRPHLAADPGARARLAREVEVLRRVRSPRVAEVLDADPDAEQPYLVTQFVPAPPLDAYVADHGPMAGADLARLALGLGDALAAIHNTGVVHRDLKPANVLVRDGEAVVIDFGIAQIADDVRLTSTGLVMGTPGFMAPEVLEGVDVTPAADWWGWAATVAYAATGRSPFGGGPTEAVLSRVRRGVVDLQGCPAALAAVLAAALAPDPASRPRPRHLREAVQALTASQPSGWPAPPVASGPPPVPRSVPRRPAAAVELPATTPLGDAPPATTPATTPLTTPATTPATTVSPQRQDATVAFDASGEATSADRSRSDDFPYRIGQFDSRGRGARPAVDRSARTTPTAYPPAPAVDDVVFGSPPASPEAGRVVPRRGSEVGDDASRPPRRGLIALLLVALVAAASVAPGAALVVVLAGVVLARTVDRAHRALQNRRLVHGVRRSDGAATALAVPAHLLGAAVVSVAALVLPALMAVSAAFLVGWAVDPAAADPDGHLPLAAGALSGLLTAWWGPGGVPLRHGSRDLVGALVRTRRTALVLVAVCALLALAAVLVSQGQQVPDWTPWHSSGV